MPTVDALVATHLVAACDASADQPERPCLELERIFFGEYGGILGGGRLANRSICRRDLWPEAVHEPVLDKSYRKVGYVNANPSPGTRTRDLLLGRQVHLPAELLPLEIATFAPPIGSHSMAVGANDVALGGFGEDFLVGSAQQPST